jgi:hypothetical protein
MLAYVVMCTALGTIMAAIVERPALAIRDRLFPAPKKTHLTEPLEPEPITVIPAPVAETASA